MKRSKLFLAFTLMLGLVACLFSVPVLSGENPWDADGGNGGGTGSPMDSVLNDAGMIHNTPVVQSPTEPDDYNLGWFSQATVKVSSFLLGFYYQWNSAPAQKYKYGY